MSMRFASSRPVSARLSPNARDILQELEALRANGRLAYRVAELKDNNRLCPTEDWQHLNANARMHEQFTQTPEMSLTKDDVSLFSMSLLPGPESGCCIYPFIEEKIKYNISHLYSLNEQEQPSARVVRVFPTVDHVTGCGRRNKKYHLDVPTGIPELDALYKQLDDQFRIGPFHRHGKAQEEMLNRVMHDQGITSLQLDAIKRYHDSAQAPGGLIKEGEALVVAYPHNVKAIAHHMHAGSGGEQYARLLVALSGLDHLDKEKIDLPAVLYHVDGPNIGGFSYVARGEEECRQATTQAIEALHHRYGSAKGFAKQFEPWHDGLRHDAKELTGIDIYKPLAEQGVTLPQRGAGV